MRDLTLPIKVVRVNYIPLTVMYQGWKWSDGMIGLGGKGTCVRFGNGVNESPTLAAGVCTGDHEGVDECVGELEVGCGYTVGVLKAREKE